MSSIIKEIIFVVYAGFRKIGPGKIDPFPVAQKYLEEKSLYITFLELLFIHFVFFYSLRDSKHSWKKHRVRQSSGKYMV